MLSKKTSGAALTPELVRSMSIRARLTTDLDISGNDGGVMFSADDCLPADPSYAHGTFDGRTFACREILDAIGVDWRAGDV